MLRFNTPSRRPRGAHRSACAGLCACPRKPRYRTHMDDFDDAGGIAGRWLNVAPGASPDSAGASSACSGAAAAARMPPSRARHSPAAAPAHSPSQRQSEAAAAVSACAAGADDRALTAMLESISLPHLESLASIALDVLAARRAAPTPAAASAPRQPAPQHRKPRAPAPAPSSRGNDELDELDGSIAGRWLQVPPGGTLGEDGLPQAARAAEASMPAKKVAAPPKKPPPKAAPRGDLD